MDAVTTVEIIHWICVCTSDWLCSVTLILKSGRLLELAGLVAAPFGPDDEASRSVIARADRTVAGLSKKITVLVFVALAAALLKEPLFGTRKLPLYGWFPFPVTDWSQGYWVALIFQVSFALNICLCECAHMVIFVAFGLHLAARVRILRMSLRRLDQVTPQSITPCIEQHLAVLRYFDIFQEIYSYVLLTTALASALKSCTIGYLVTDPKTTSATTLSLIAILVPEMSTAVLYCWLGQIITDEGEKLREAVYGTMWYQQTGDGVSFKKTEIMMMQLRCAAPLTLSGRGLQNFSREGLAEILALSYSYFNMLTALRAKK
ncbi:hypothetical protein AAG570_003516 [Ranatra chinensis]|uniref:Odorant receptor n=1 Tax=Ranatra chinensis TaxID=642074 RepID=A0ABD0Y3W9_9HEMI